MAYDQHLADCIREREDWNGKHQAACLEIERLRAALTSLMEFAWYASGNDTFTATVPGITLDKAKAALKQSK